MIRTEKEYKEAVRQIARDQKMIQKQRKELEKQNLNESEIARLIDPLLTFCDDIVQDVEIYEKIKRQDFDLINSFTHVGIQLIALRIASGLTQNDLAKCLSVSAAQVSRDERNEYHGITIERAEKILAIFGAHLKANVTPNRTLDKKNIMATYCHAK